MAVGRLKTWIASEILTASDLNAEFNNILTNGEDLPFPATKAKDFDGNQLILDSNQDTHITADTDDRIDFAAGGADIFRMDGTVATPVNGIDFIAAATGSAPSWAAFGSDTDIDINFIPKAGGILRLKGVGLRRPEAPFKAATLEARLNGEASDGEVVLSAQIFR